MTNADAYNEWETYRSREYAGVLPVLERLGFTLEKDQPHIEGERFLMQAVTTASGKKLILLGTRKSDGARVVIKATSDRKGAEELKRERACRIVLERIRFAYDVFFSPKELLFTTQGSYTIVVHEFLAQQCAFLERPLEEQFFFALQAFKAQESARATTYKHMRIVAKAFGVMDAARYVRNFKQFYENVAARLQKNDATIELLEKGTRVLEAHQKDIEQYCGFLVHTDFVPHNFRIFGENIYLLDQSSLRFGNKYEGWARFLNFMMLYNPALERALVEYVKDNRTHEESTSLVLMRIYRLAEIIWFYVNAREKTSGNLRMLEERRIVFWTEALRALLDGVPLADDIRKEYIAARDALRSEEEKRRQIGLH